MFIEHLPQGRIGAVALDYPDGAHVDLHLHNQAQFLYAAQGLMRLVTEAGAWVIPPTRAVWIPPGIEHQIFMSGQVQMRTLFIAADAAPPNLDACCVLAVPPLLRELILRLVALEAGDTDDEHRSLVQRLILHE
ncbi:AraC family ligand binding domain-containing protein, partial [Metapseudomonas otitidis]|uniref:AraC family ligand binding domain-containing protein n=2 Tax=Pseudomonadaceae TaxID=135621 RepID=UPI001980CDD7